MRFSLVELSGPAFRHPGGCRDLRAGGRVCRDVVSDELGDTARSAFDWGEIPAFAGMTGAFAGMTGAFAGMTGAFAGMTGAFAGMTGAFAGMTVALATMTSGVSRSRPGSSPNDGGRIHTILQASTRVLQ
ncbi:MAG: hypothetical protein IPL41_16275 [Micropruina sp.]|nr:hypothetical protein [Micropruina sp.]